MPQRKTSVQVVAEIGCNHKGDFALAQKMIRIAAERCGAHVVKFQKRHNPELLSPAQYNAPHPNPRHAYGNTYGAHRAFLEFDKDQHQELIVCCADHSITYSTSVWDLTSAKDMTALNPAILKVPSASNLHFEMQDYLCRHFPGEIHVSTGMSTRTELEAIVDFYQARGRGQDLVLYACTSGYPVDYPDLCLFEIRHLMERYGGAIKAVGFSGHHQGIAADVAALALGRSMEAQGAGQFRYIERHFTLNRRWKGTDHGASLEPDDLATLCRDLRQVDQALAYKPQGLLPIEEAQRTKLKWEPAAIRPAAE